MASGDMPTPSSMEPAHAEAHPGVREAVRSASRGDAARSTSRTRRGASFSLDDPVALAVPSHEPVFGQRTGSGALAPASPFEGSGPVVSPFVTEDRPGARDTVRSSSRTRRGASFSLGDSVAAATASPLHVPENGRRTGSVEHGPARPFEGSEPVLSPFEAEDVSASGARDTVRSSSRTRRGASFSLDGSAAAATAAPTHKPTNGRRTGSGEHGPASPFEGGEPVPSPFEAEDAPVSGSRDAVRAASRTRRGASLTPDDPAAAASAPASHVRAHGRRTGSSEHGSTSPFPGQRASS